MKAPLRSGSTERSPSDRADERDLRLFLGSKRYDHFGARCRKRAQRLLGINEAICIWAYTTKFGYYLTINLALRRRSPTALQSRIATLLDRALAGLPTHRGMVYRGIQLDPALLRAFLWNHTVGAEVTTRAFTSTSADIKRAFDGNVLFAITSKSGRRLGLYSSVPAEKEVLFRRGSRFRVTARRPFDTDSWFIEMEEVGDEL